MKKMSDRDKKLLYFLGAIVIVAACYFLVFSKLNAKKAELQSQTDQLRTEVSKLETMEAGKANILADTADKQNQIAQVLQKFPSEVRTQDAIYDLNKMYEGIDDVTIQSEGYTMNQLFYQPGAASDGSGTTAAQPTTTLLPAQNVTGTAITADTPAKDVVSAAANYYGYRSDVAVAFTAPYKSLKSVIDYINDSKDRMTITDISATKSDQEGSEDLLTCNMTVSMYSITGTGETYQEPNIKSDQGSEGNIFKDR